MPPLMKNSVALVICLGLSFLTASVGALLTAPSVPGWYNTIEKPSWNPPNSVFGPVWTVLYILIGISGWLAWMKSEWHRDRYAYTAYFTQLVLNAAWSGIFFTLHMPGWALLELILLWIAISATVILFWKISKPSAILLLPYFLWVSFAGALNFAIWRLNS